MDYFILFLEGIMTFVSPCLLPLLPMYIAYFVGVEEDADSKPLMKALGFVAGFSLVFMALSLFVSTLGHFLLMHRAWVNGIAGLILIALGLDYLTGQKLMAKLTPKHSGGAVLNPFAFGMLFAISWSPCVGTFLAAALSYIATVGSWGRSIGLILAYCLGLGIPFVLSALLLEEGKRVVSFIKQNYRWVHRISGVLLIIFGIMMMFGWLEDWLISLA